MNYLSLAWSYIKLITVIILIAFLAFYPTGFDAWQSISVFIITMLILKIVQEVLKMSERHKMPEGIKWRLALTIYGSIATLIFIIAFLAFYPTGFDVWQKIAIVLISLLVLGGVMAGVWIPWKMTYWEEMEDWGKKWEKWGEGMEKKHEK